MDNKDYAAITVTLRKLNLLALYESSFKNDGITDSVVSGWLSTDPSLLRRVVPLVGHQVMFMKEFKLQKSLLEYSSTATSTPSVSSDRKVDPPISEPLETPEMYKKIKARLGYDLTSPGTLLRNAHEEALKQFTAEAENHLRCAYFVLEEKYLATLQRLEEKAMAYFQDRCSLIRVGRQEEAAQLKRSIEMKIEYYMDKNKDMRAEHEQALLKRAKDLSESYLDAIKSKIGRTVVSEADLDSYHQEVRNQLCQVYYNEFSTSPIFDHKILQNMIEEQLPSILADVEDRNVQKKCTYLMSNSLKRYEEEMRKVLVVEDFEEAHEKMVSEIRQSFISIDEKLYHFADMTKIINEAKVEAMNELKQRVAVTEQRIQAILHDAKNKYSESIKRVMGESIPTDKIVLSFHHQRNAEIALKMFSDKFQEISASIKNSDRVRQTLLEDLKTAIQAQEEENINLNEERWIKYLIQLESAVNHCNAFYETELAKVDQNNFGAANKIQEITYKVDRMFADEAELELFEPQCIKIARERMKQKRLAVLSVDKNPIRTGVIRDIFLPDSAEAVSSDLEKLRIDSGPRQTTSLKSKDTVTIPATQAAHNSATLDFLVKLNKGKLELQTDVFQKCQDYIQQRNIPIMFFISIVGQRNSGKTTIANLVDQMLCTRKVLENNGDIIKFNPQYGTNGVLVFLQPGIRTYEDQPAAVFLLDVHAPQASKEEYTALVDFCLMASTQIVFSVRPPQYEIHARSSERSIVSKYFGPMDKLNLHVLLQLDSDTSYSQLCYVQTEAELQDHPASTSMDLREISLLPKDLEGSSFCVIPSSDNFGHIQDFLSKTLSEPELSSRRLINCEANVQEKIEQINFLSGLMNGPK